MHSTSSCCKKSSSGNYIRPCRNGYWPVPLYLGILGLRGCHQSQAMVPRHVSPPHFEAICHSSNLHCTESVLTNNIKGENRTFHECVAEQFLLSFLSLLSTKWLQTSKEDGLIKWTIQRSPQKAPFQTRRPLQQYDWICSQFTALFWREHIESYWVQMVPCQPWKC